MAPMKRQEAIEIIMTTIGPRDAVVSTTGLISREIFERFDSERNIYAPGSMGLVSSIGLGLAMTRPATLVVVIDGDASLLMNLGSIVTIGNKQPTNLLHIVLDNGAYASCNEERSMSNTAKLDVLAGEVGYQYVRTADSQDGLKRAIMEFERGPGFILAKIELGGRRDFRRPLELAAIKNRFMLFLARQT
jgi:thiamine pyrophosphate-dependent acetolactate synthase large subunit-like protein